jgi:adenylate cyclase
MFGSRENDLLKRALALYAGDHVLQHVLRNGKRAFVVDPADIDLTVMFVDVVANFSEIREDLTPNELNEFMASFLEVTTNGIVESGGTVDIYVGDSTSAWWGAKGEKDHAESAVRCARQLVAEMSRLNQTFQGKGWPTLRLCVGIASGRVRLGTYGTSKRLRYSVLGDTVNLSSRLCGLAAGHYPHAVLVADSTQKRLGASSSLVPVDTVRVKGRDEPVQLFTV